MSKYEEAFKMVELMEKIGLYKKRESILPDIEEKQKLKDKDIRSINNYE